MVAYVCHATMLRLRKGDPKVKSRLDNIVGLWRKSNQTTKFRRWVREQEPV